MIDIFTTLLQWKLNPFQIGMNYFTCKVGSNNFITEKRKKTSSIPCLQSHCIQLQKKQKKQKQKNYETKYIHDEPDPGSNIVTSSKY